MERHRARADDAPPVYRDEQRARAPLSSRAALPDAGWGASGGWEASGGWDAAGDWQTTAGGAVVGDERSHDLPSRLGDSARDEGDREGWAAADGWHHGARDRDFERRYDRGGGRDANGRGEWESERDRAYYDHGSDARADHGRPADRYEVSWEGEGGRGAWDNGGDRDGRGAHYNDGGRDAIVKERRSGGGGGYHSGGGGGRDRERSHGTQGHRVGGGRDEPPVRETGRGGALRGIHCLKDAPPFDRIPSFETKADCEAFVRRECSRWTNPDYPRFRHLFSMLVDWGQIAQYLVAESNRIDAEVRAPSEEVARRVESLPTYAVPDAVLASLRARFDLPFHQRFTRESTRNTLTYLFFHMRCGIYARICGNKLVMFAPFANLYYRNNWGQDLIQYDPRYGGNREEYYRSKEAFYRRENVLPDVDRWWANGCIMDNELPATVWGDHLLAQMKDLLQEVCATREIGDCEFFLNKRDHPQLKADLSEPYDFLYASAAPPLTRERHDAYAPVCSFFSSDLFADILIPSSDDWEIATGRVFPRAAGDNYSEKNRSHWNVPWEERKQTAFFRGSATGGGCTVETNPRIHIAQISHEWSTNPALCGSDEVPRYLDAALTTWNLRDKKLAGRPMTFVNPTDFPFKVGTENYVPMYEQARFKYLVYIDGHCAAARYAFLMRSGSVILKVDSKPSQTAGHLWFFPLLRPFEDHVPVKHDFSDLQEKIEWCRANDDRCHQIAANARRLYDDHVGREGILNYFATILNEISRRTDHLVWEPLADGFPSQYTADQEPIRYASREPPRRSDQWVDARSPATRLDRAVDERRERERHNMAERRADYIDAARRVDGRRH
eukprot:Opistho-1_new@86264